jgi:uncharacterized protein YecT (DUF1311 family)
VKKTLVGGFTLAGVLLAGVLGAQPASEPDPCAQVYGQGDLNSCWAREADRAEEEMSRLYLTARQTLPKRAAERLEKAQKLWLEFRDAHIATLYGVENPTARWGREYPMCLSISRTTLTRARIRELQRILEPDEDTVCPL